MGEDALTRAVSELRRALGDSAQKGAVVRPSARTNQEHSSWIAAWLDHLPVYEKWIEGRLDEARALQGEITRTLPRLVEFDRDATGSAAGYMWLTLGRLADAREAFGMVGHTGQREMNLARMADLLGDRRTAAAHLQRVPWAFNPVPFARVGDIARAQSILRAPHVNGPRVAEAEIVAGLESIAAGRYGDAVGHLERAVLPLRRSPHFLFYDASESLAHAWTLAGNPGQAVRVLEEATQTRPVLEASGGIAGAWWIRTQVQLVQAYRAAGRHADAADLERRVRALLAHADPDHSFLKALDAVN